jgi:Pyruvate/2-oxoacid:ferredoxin oxidoreductase delta subunit
VKGDGIRSNHHLVSYVLEIAKIVQRTSVGKWILGSLERLKKECTKFQPEGAIFFTKLRKVIRFYKEFCKGCKFHKEGCELKQDLECIQGNLQNMVQDERLQQQVSTLRLRIKEVENVKATR